MAPAAPRPELVNVTVVSAVVVPGRRRRLRLERPTRSPPVAGAAAARRGATAGSGSPPAAPHWRRRLSGANATNATNATTLSISVVSSTAQNVSVPGAAFISHYNDPQAASFAVSTVAGLTAAAAAASAIPASAAALIAQGGVTYQISFTVEATVGSAVPASCVTLCRSRCAHRYHINMRARPCAGAATAESAPPHPALPSGGVPAGLAGGAGQLAVLAHRRAGGAEPVPPGCAAAL